MPPPPRPAPVAFRLSCDGQSNGGPTRDNPPGWLAPPRARSPATCGRSLPAVQQPGGRSSGCERTFHTVVVLVADPACAGSCQPLSTRQSRKPCFLAHSRTVSSRAAFAAASCSGSTGAGRLSLALPTITNRSPAGKNLCPLRIRIVNLLSLSVELSSNSIIPCRGQLLRCFLLVR